MSFPSATVRMSLVVELDVPDDVLAVLADDDDLAVAVAARERVAARRPLRRGPPPEPVGLDDLYLTGGDDSGGDGGEVC